MKLVFKHPYETWDVYSLTFGRPRALSHLDGYVMAECMHQYGLPSSKPNVIEIASGDRSQYETSCNERLSELGSRKVNFVLADSFLDKDKCVDVLKGPLKGKVDAVLAPYYSVCGMTGADFVTPKDSWVTVLSNTTGVVKPGGLYLLNMYPHGARREIKEESFSFKHYVPASNKLSTHGDWAVVKYRRKPSTTEFTHRVSNYVDLKIGKVQVSFEQPLVLDFPRLPKLLSTMESFGFEAVGFKDYSAEALEDTLRATRDVPKNSATYLIFRKKK